MLSALRLPLRHFAKADTDSVEGYWPTSLRAGDDWEKSMAGLAEAPA